MFVVEQKNVHTMYVKQYWVGVWVCLGIQTGDL